MNTFVEYRLAGSDELFAVSMAGVAVDIEATFRRVFKNLDWDLVEVDRTWVSSSVLPSVPVWRHVKKSGVVSYLPAPKWIATGDGGGHWDR